MTNKTEVFYNLLGIVGYNQKIFVHSQPHNSVAEG